MVCHHMVSQPCCIVLRYSAIQRYIDTARYIKFDVSPPLWIVVEGDGAHRSIYACRRLRSRLNGVLATDGAFLTVPFGHQEVTS